MSDPKKHARCAPSSAERWMTCHGSLAMEAQFPPEPDNEYSEEGTAAHELAALALTEGNRCEVYVGRKAENGWTFSEDMAEDTQIYVDNLLEYAEGNKLLVEQRMSIEHITTEKDAAGTSDGVIITNDLEELQVHDLKFGRGIKVDAEYNKQLMMYALAALEQFNAIGLFKRVRLVIHQPRLSHLSEWSISVGDLMLFAREARAAAEIALDLADNPQVYPEGGIHPVMMHLNASEDGCRWCRAQATCPALADYIKKEVGEDFLNLAIINDVSGLIPADPGALADKMNAIDMIETWCKAVRAEVERYLLRGFAVPGFKVVQGKQGNRRWSDEKVVEDVLKKMRCKLEEMYSFNLISPTAAEKLFKTNPRQWKKLQDFITRSEGKPSVAPSTDPRPAIEIQPVSEDFDNVTPGSEFA